MSCPYKVFPIHTIQIGIVRSVAETCYQCIAQVHAQSDYTVTSLKIGVNESAEITILRLQNVGIDTGFADGLAVVECIVPAVELDGRVAVGTVT